MEEQVWPSNQQLPAERLLQLQFPYPEAPPPVFQIRYGSFQKSFCKLYEAAGRAVRCNNPLLPSCSTMIYSKGKFQDQCVCTVGSQEVNQQHMQPRHASCTLDGVLVHKCHCIQFVSSSRLYRGTTRDSTHVAMGFGQRFGPRCPLVTTVSQFSGSPLSLLGFLGCSKNQGADSPRWLGFLSGRQPSKTRSAGQNAHRGSAFVKFVEA